MENRLEKKLRFFALYFGQEVHRGNRSKHLDHLSIMRNQKFGHLELKSISDITDEDAIEVATLFNWYRLPSMSKRDWKVERIYNDNIRCTLSDNHFDMEVIISLNGSVWSNDITLPTNIKTTPHHIDYLRSKGYLLPFMDLSIEQILEYKWAVIK